jgi:hypothetical protein
MTKHVEYETTIDEIADAHLRAYARSKMAKRLRWQSTFWVGALTSLLLYLLLTLRGASLPDRFAFAALGVVIAVGGYSLNYRRSLKRRVIRHLREQLATEAPIRFAVELREDCIWTKQGGTQLSFDWDNVSQIVDAGDAVELRMFNGGFVMVRNKGFPSGDSRQEFMSIANKRLQASAGRDA